MNHQYNSFQLLVLTAAVLFLALDNSQSLSPMVSPSRHSRNSVRWMSETNNPNPPDWSSYLPVPTTGSTSSEEEVEVEGTIQVPSEPGQSNTRFSAFAPDSNLDAEDFRAQLKENMKADLERRRREDPHRGNQPAKNYLDSL